MLDKMRWFSSNKKRWPSPEEQQEALDILLDSLDEGFLPHKKALGFVGAVVSRMTEIDNQLAQPDHGGKVSSKGDLEKELRTRLECPVVDTVAKGLLRYREVLCHKSSFPSPKKMLEHFAARRDRVNEVVRHLAAILDQNDVKLTESARHEISQQRTICEQQAALLVGTTLNLERVVAKQRPEQRSCPEVVAERELVSDFLCIPDGSVPIETLIEELLPRFAEELIRQGGEALISMEELTIPDSAGGRDATSVREILLAGAIRTPLDLDRAYLSSVLRYRREGSPTNVPGFLGFDPVAALLIVLGQQAPHSHDDDADPRAGGDYPEPVVEAIARLRDAIVRDRFREVIGEGRVTRRHKEKGPKKPRKGKATESPAPRATSRKGGVGVDSKRAKSESNVTPAIATTSQSDDDSTSLDMMGTPPPK